MTIAAWAVFVLVTSGSTLIFSRTWLREARAVRRVAGVGAVIIRRRPRLSWPSILERVGGLLSGTRCVSPALLKNLTAAGYRHPNALRIFRGFQILGGLLAATLAVAGALLSGAASNALAFAFAGCLVGYMAPSHIVSWRASRRRKIIEKSIPNALDLLVVCVEAGLGLDLAILQVATELRDCFPDISSEFLLLNMEMRAGKRRADALHALAERTGVEDLRKLVAVLIQTDRFGTSIAEALRNHADYMRAMARQRAEERAAKLAVKLIFPIFFFILPALFVVTVGPVMLRIVRDLLPLLERM
jgi:tight adherence protein C